MLIGGIKIDDKVVMLILLLFIGYMVFNAREGFSVGGKNNPCIKNTNDPNTGTWSRNCYNGGAINYTTDVLALAMPYNIGQLGKKLDVLNLKIDLIFNKL